MPKLPEQANRDVCFFGDGMDEQLSVPENFLQAPSA
jgi:hypothetical protein